ncbi:hypothetical protein BC829DRAFT_22689 [Chytridium lagenaria]|nr:hypothetical protein BC829DRAFT_22689 [Chytridium lagenaria]
MEADSKSSMLNSKVNQNDVFPASLDDSVPVHDIPLNAPSADQFLDAVHNDFTPSLNKKKAKAFGKVAKPALKAVDASPAPAPTSTPSIQPNTVAPALSASVAPVATLIAEVTATSALVETLIPLSLDEIQATSTTLPTTTFVATAIVKVPMADSAKALDVTAAQQLKDAAEVDRSLKSGFSDMVPPPLPPHYLDGYGVGEDVDAWNYADFEDLENGPLLEDTHAHDDEAGPNDAIALDLDDAFLAPLQDDLNIPLPQSLPERPKKKLHKGEKKVSKKHEKASPTFDEPYVEKAHRKPAHKKKKEEKAERRRQRKGLRRLILLERMPSPKTTRSPLRQSLRLLL